MRLNGMLVGSVLLTAVACAGTASQLAPTDAAQIKSVYDSLAQATIRADVAAVAKLMAADAWSSLPNQAPLSGRDSIAAWAKLRPKVLSMTFNVDEIGGEGSVAYARVSGTEVYELHDGLSSTYHFTCLDMLRRRTDRSWELSRGMCHSTEPMYKPRV